MKGLSSVEVLLVILGIVILFALILPLGLDFYKDQQLQTHTQGILQSLRRAQLKAISIESDSNFGVYIIDDNYTLFQGSSFAARNALYDEIFDLPQAITVSGLSEIVFSKFEGKPNVAGDIIVNSDGQSRTININGVGRINLQ